MWLFLIPVPLVVVFAIVIYRLSRACVFTSSPPQVFYRRVFVLFGLFMIIAVYMIIASAFH